MHFLKVGKKAETVTSLTSKLNLRIATSKNKGGLSKETLIEEQVKRLVRYILCNF